MRSIITLLIFCCWFGLFTFSCKDKKEPTMVDPCATVKTFKAEFKIMESVADTLIETDSILIYNSAVFVGAEGYDSYQWKIGNDTTSYTTQKFSLLFSDREVSINEVITVQLTAKKKASTCYPNDKTTDVLTKSFRIIHWKDAPIIGKYEGYFGSDKNKSDKQVVEVKHYFEPSGYVSSKYGKFAGININKGCNLIVDPRSIGNPEIKAYAGGFGIRASRGLYQDTNDAYNGCLGPSGSFILKGRDTLIVEFSQFISEKNLIRINDTFIGARKKN